MSTNVYDRTMEEVDVLLPPMFEPSGEVMTATEAIRTGKWLGSANVWVYRYKNNQIEFLYQEREPNSAWMPSKLDVAAGGYFIKGEARNSQTRLIGAMRELKEELGISVEPSRLQYVTRRLNVGLSQKGNERKTCCSIFCLEVTDSDQIVIDGEEVTAIYWIPLQDILSMHVSPQAHVDVTRIDNQDSIKKTLTAGDFCHNYDDYLFTMPATITALLSSN